jgi:hypothetical protein
MSSYFNTFFMTTVTNAFLIFKEHFEKGDDYVILTFLEKLVNQLAFESVEEQQIQPPARPIHLLHTPMMHDHGSRRTCKVCSIPKQS